MKSVDALRKWADGLSVIWIDPNDHSIIVTTCDDMPPSIDCVNLRDHVNGILDGIEREVADMVPLPVDADGVPIHVGDVMEWPDCSTAEVVGIGDGTFFYVEDGEDAAEWSCASDKIHHHALTIEDVLREFADEVYADADNEIRDRDFLCAKYAKRLTLAGEE